MIINKRNAFKQSTNEFVTAAAIGTVLAQLFVQWLSLCGNSGPALVNFLLGLSTGAVLMQWFGELLRSSVSIASYQRLLRAGATLVLITLCWVQPLLLELTFLAGCETIPSTFAASEALTLLFPSLIVALVSGTAILCFRVSTSASHETVGSSPPSQAIATSEITWMQSLFAGGFGVVLILVPAVIPMPVAVLSTTALLVSLAVGFSSKTEKHSSLTDRTLQQSAVDQSRYSPVTAMTAHAAAVGFLMVAVSEIVARLMPTNVPTLALSIGLSSLLLTLLGRKWIIRLLRPEALNLIAFIVLAVLPVCFPILASLNIAMTNQVSSAFAVLFLRSLQCCFLATACLLPAALSLQNFSRLQRQKLPVGTAALLSMTLTVALGLLAHDFGLSPSSLVAVGLALHGVGLLYQSSLKNSVAGPTSGRSDLGILNRPVILMLMIISLLPAVTTLNSVRASAMLFSPRTVAAIERGVHPDLIAQSDSNRLMLTTSAASGEYSVWRRAGNVVEFHRNGVSLGKVSTETAVTPQPPEEILPAILGLVGHAKPARVLVLGDETGTCLRTCSNFPVPEIVAVRSRHVTTQLASQYTWSSQTTPADQDPRISILNTSPMIALQQRHLSKFDVVIAASASPASLEGVTDFTVDFYQSVRSRMSPDGIFCQRFRQQGLGPEPVKAAMATLMSVFKNVGVIQTIPEELILLGSNVDEGLIASDLLKRFQRDHVRQEIATAGWDWAQVAVLPLIDAGDPVGIFSQEPRPATITMQSANFSLSLPFECMRRFGKGEATRAAFAPHEIQMLAALTPDEDHKEAARRLSALTQQLEILAGMPDQPWTYRKSLRMEMQRNPRPPQEIIQNDEIRKTAHPLDLFSRQYVLSLGRALTAVSMAPLTGAEIAQMERFTEKPEPLLSHFAHYEIIRLHELAHHPAPADEFRHRLHTVFFTSPSDASVRPVIAAIDQLVMQPSLINESAARYDMLNSLVQKLIERWEARTVWTPRSAKRVQNDVDQSIRLANRALDLMETSTDAANVSSDDFLRRRRYINEALIGPLRKYRDQVLAHRLKTETPAEADPESPDDLPLLITPDDNLSTN